MNILIFLIMATLTKTATLDLESTAFKQNGSIPLKYSCEGENINPPITIKNIPQGTKSLALIMDDPDAPHGTFDHWIVWNIKPGEIIKENSVPGTQGKNGYGKSQYAGPCPPTGTHRYFFKIYALDTQLDIPSGSDKKSLEKVIQLHILAQGELMGTYKKQK